MPRVKNPGPGPLTLASGRVLDEGEALAYKGSLDPEDQAHLDEGRLVAVAESNTRAKRDDSSQES